MLLACAPLPAAAVGLALPYTPVGALEGMVALPLSFYAWVAATVAGAGLRRAQAGSRGGGGGYAERLLRRQAPAHTALPLDRMPALRPAAYAITVQLAKRLYIRSFGGWL